MSGKIIEVSLAVMFVGSGGNTRDGRYFYSFTPAIVDVTEPDTEIVYSLTEDTPKRFVLADLYANDVGMTLRDKKVHATQRSLSVVNKNTQHQLVILSLLVLDGTTRINCDPQMTNSPTEPTAL